MSDNEGIDFPSVEQVCNAVEEYKKWCKDNGYNPEHYLIPNKVWRKMLGV